jgi:hypothetical protein
LKIVEQPFRRGRDRLSRSRGSGDGAVGLGQDVRVVVEARLDRAAGPALGIDTLRRREAFGVLLHALDAEKLRANGRLRRLGGVLPENARARCVQGRQPLLDVEPEP